MTIDEIEEWLLEHSVKAEFPCTHLGCCGWKISIRLDGRLPGTRCHHLYGETLAMCIERAQREIDREVPTLRLSD